ncbi:MAG: 4Fe-4S dicluster domain-containing protein [Methylotenera sp.]|uniref:(Fe-S)-binding protein n=1 Tax=Methylotenera sp. TaxID=2051956 RepID=UPI0024874716|nr:4Fe-4S dicluster domain-containing protein [Methylotenera sp.]MDI1310437.1 4Fe-4S dicluster domain-containing protein [Methylotenera sp.]
MKKPFEPKLDWSAYDSYGEGDAYAQIPAKGGAYGKAASLCIGSRTCQRTDAGVMCPSFRLTNKDAHSTRHRAATLKAALNGELGEHPFISPDLADAMELCVACKGCKRECPNGVDMAMLRTEALAQHWTAIGKIPLRERLTAHLPRFAHHFKHIKWLSRLRQEVPLIAKLFEKYIGIAAKRSLPKAAPNSFMSSAPSTHIAESAREVVLLVDTFSNHFDPDIAQAALEVLQAGGYTVHFARPAKGERALCCGRTYFSNGMINEARAEAMRLVNALWPFVQRGLPVIGLEPSCLLMLRDEYLMLNLDERVPVLAKAALLLEEFIAREHTANQLYIELKPITAKALIHGHCHQKAFGAMKSMHKVLSLVPDLQVEFIESSCCGMAGAFGMKAEHYEASMQMAELALLPQIRAAGTDNLIIANGTSCRHQILDGVGRQPLHLAQILRASINA